MYDFLSDKLTIMIPLLTIIALESANIFTLPKTISWIQIAIGSLTVIYLILKIIKEYKNVKSNPKDS